MSYREHLGGFLRESAAALGRKPEITHEAKRLAVGRPDDDLTHHRKLLAALRRTLELLPAADGIFETVLAENGETAA